MSGPADWSHPARSRELRLTRRNRLRQWFAGACELVFSGLVLKTHVAAERNGDRMAGSCEAAGRAGPLHDKTRGDMTDLPKVRRSWADFETAREDSGQLAIANGDVD